MPTIEEQIESIQKEIRETPYHKGTEHYIGLLRAKIARLKDKQIEASTRKTGGGGGYSVKKQGDATVVLVGPPSAGKSTLLNKLTNAKSKIAPYAFTTVSVIPGMMKYKDAQIQILDVPGLIEGAEEGKGRGREVLSVVRSSDLLIIMSDVTRPEILKSISETLERNGIRINKTPPDVVVEKKIGGGVIVKTNISGIDKEKVKQIAMEFGIKNGEIMINEYVTDEELIDSFSTNRVYIPALYVLNKADLGKTKKIEGVDLYISAEKEENIEQFRKAIWDKLGLVRVYLVRRDEEPNINNSLVVKKDYTLKDVAQEIGSDFAEENKKAVIWGPGSKFPGQEVSINTIVQEGMMVRFI